MFRAFMGLPLHPLAVHAAVIFVPLLALGSAGYAVLPRVRRRLGWVMWGLAIAAPVTTFVATESGEAFQQVLTVKQYSAHVLDLVATHAEFARAMFSSQPVSASRRSCSYCSLAPYEVAACRDGWRPRWSLSYWPSPAPISSTFTWLVIRARGRLGPACSSPQLYPDPQSSGLARLCFEQHDRK
jgi:hypothetical protein